MGFFKEMFYKVLISSRHLIQKKVVKANWIWMQYKQSRRKLMSNPIKEKLWLFKIFIFVLNKRICTSPTDCYINQFQSVFLEFFSWTTNKMIWDKVAGCVRLNIRLVWFQNNCETSRVNDYDSKDDCFFLWRDKMMSVSLRKRQKDIAHLSIPT